MNSALSPREIQARLRAGASVAEVASEAGVDADRITGFALPVMAERAHMMRTALGASVRRRGDGSGHRRLGEIVQERMQARGLDADTVEWDAWRQNDLKWRLVGHVDDQATSRVVEFIFDPKGRFSIAENADARWMIGEALPSERSDQDNENTIDFSDELALVRAITDPPQSPASVPGRPGDEFPPSTSQYEGAAHTSELDELYDMLSGVSEDSVRIYLGLDDSEHTAKDVAPQPPTSRSEGSPTGLDDAPTSPALPSSIITDDAEPTARSHADSPAKPVKASDEPEATLADKLSEHPELAGKDDASTPSGQGSPESGGAEAAPSGSTGSTPLPTVPEQDALVQDVEPAPTKRKAPKKRASIPSWDEIMFGGPTRG